MPTYLFTAGLIGMLSLSACASNNKPSSPEEVTATEPSKAVEPSKPTSNALVEGMCPSGYTQVTQDRLEGQTHEGASWSFDVAHGCGCPGSDGPEFVVAYETKTNPLAIRLCHDESKDPCERGCQATGSFDLSDVLASEPAAGVTLKVD